MTDGETGTAQQTEMDALHQRIRELEQETRQQQRIMDSLLEGVIVQGADLRVLWANKRAGEMVNLPPEALIGRPCFEVSVCCREKTELCPVQEAMRIGQMHSQIVHTADGRVWQLRGYPVRDESGQIVGGMEVTLEITDQMQAIEALQTSEERFARMAEGVQDGLAIIEGGEVVYVNDRLSQITGYSVEELYHMQAIDIAAPEEHERVAAMQAEYQVSGKMPPQFDFWIERKNGTRAFVRNRYSSGLDATGHGTHYLTMTDLTGQRLMEDALTETERTFRRVVEALPLGMHIYQMEPDGALRCILSNPAADAILGLGHPVEGRILTEILPAIATTPLLDTYREVLNSGESFQGRYTTRGTGSVTAGRSFEIVAFRVGPNDIAVTFADVSDRVQAEEALRASEERFAKAFHTSPDSININRLSDGLYLDINQGFTDLTGYTEEDVAGQTSADIDIWDDMADRKRLVDGLRKAGVVRGLEAKFRFKNGIVHTGLMSARVIELAGEMCILSITRDIQDRIDAEEEIRELNETLEQRVEQRTAELQEALAHLRQISKVKDEFVSNVSHELRTPIANLKLHQYLLAAQPEKFEEHLDIIRRETDRLEHIIESLLQLSRLEQNRIDNTEELVNVNRMVSDLVKDRQRLAHEAGVTLTLRMRPETLTVQADADLLADVLSVLLTNALNYTPPGGQVTVHTLLDQVAGRFRVGFRVADSGPGILPEERERLFERFFRGSAGRNSGQPGTGLGLAIAREIVSRYDGVIEAESSGVPGEGAAFTVWLPL